MLDRGKSWILRFHHKAAMGEANGLGSGAENLECGGLTPLSSAPAKTGYERRVLSLTRPVYCERFGGMGQFAARRSRAAQSGVKPPHSKIHIDGTVDVDVENAHDL